MIGAGQRAPDVTVWRTTKERVTTGQLAQEGPYILLFYIFDWTGT